MYIEQICSQNYVHFTINILQVLCWSVVATYSSFELWVLNLLLVQNHKIVYSFWTRMKQNCFILSSTFITCASTKLLKIHLSRWQHSLATQYAANGVVYIFWTGPRTEGIKFGPPDRAIIFFGRGSDLENFYLNKFLLDNSK